MNDQFWRDFGLTWTFAAIISIAYLSAIGHIEDRDKRISQLERAKATCQAVRDGEIATQTYRNGVIECAIHSGKSGNRVTQRMEFRS